MSEQAKRMLITGAGGFLGSHLVAAAPGGTDVFGTVWSSPCSLGHDRTFRIDIGDTDQLNGVLNQVMPDVIIHTAAISKEGACRADVKAARKINVDSTEAIGHWAANNGARMIFTSTDLVFDGRKGHYSENDERHSEMVYGELKIEAEDLLVSKAGVLTVRLPLLYGIGLGERKGILWSFMEACRERKPLDLFTDEYRSPLFVEDAARFIWRLTGMTNTGRLHLGGPERFSRLMIGAAFATELDLDGIVARPVTRADKHMEYRPADTSLDSSKAQALGFRPMPLSQGLATIRHDIEQGLY
jgi:dTDP-4-dehydrorhamnose reductase